MAASIDRTWTHSTFDRARSRDRVEWRIDGDVVQLRHSGHLDQGILTLSLREWKHFIAAAQSGQAGTIAY